MIFLAVLLISTAAAALWPRARRNPRIAARLGLGLAFVVAGITHFVNPTPFEQHLPSWVPLVALVVLVSGAVEVALGLALALARGAHEQALIGRAVAAFLVAVFPANVFVAVSGVEVDGQPGGAYPWLRLPLQLLFIGWALWSTSTPPTSPAGPRRRSRRRPPVAVTAPGR